MDIAGVEIFRAGNYGEKGTYSEADLDLIAHSYDPRKCEAPITIDHQDSGPAFGWVAKVYRVGKSLFADFRDVTEDFAEQLRTRRYKKRSVEIYHDHNVLGKFYLRAVTFLGAALPAVNGMADIVFAAPGGGDTLAISWAESTAAFADSAPLPVVFAEIVDPNPNGHSAIVRDTWTGAVLNHDHVAHLDDAGNGFTSLARASWDGEHSGAGEMCDNHTHEILAGVVLPSGRISHTHALPYAQGIFSERGNHKMAAIKNADPKAGEQPEIITVARFSEVSAEAEKAKADLEAEKAKNADLEKANKTLGKDRAEFAEQIEALSASVQAMKAEAEKAKACARFAEVFDAAFSEGRVTAAQRDELQETYLELSGANEVHFGDGAKLTGSSRERFLHSIASAPVVVPLQSEGKRREVSFSSDTPPAPSDRAEFSAWASKRAREIMADDRANDGDGVPFDRALVQAFAEGETKHNGR